MASKAVAIALLVMLAACGRMDRPLLETTKFVPVVPTEDMYGCPVVKEGDLPQGDYNNKDIATQAIILLYESYDKCSNSLKAIRKYMDDAVLEIEKGNKK